MAYYVSKPTIIDAIQHVGNFTNLEAFAGDKVRIDPATGSLELLAGQDGAQDWVPVPLNHWLVHMPNDPSDMWPVAPSYFDEKYEKL